MADLEKPQILSNGILIPGFKINPIQNNELVDLVVGTSCLSDGIAISSPREPSKPIFVLGTKEGEYFSHKDVPFSRKLQSLSGTPWGYVHHLRKHKDFITRAKRGGHGPYAQRRVEMWFQAGAFDQLRINGKEVLDIQGTRNGTWLVALIEENNKISYHLYDSEGEMIPKAPIEILDTFQQESEEKMGDLFGITEETRFNDPTLEGAYYSLEIPGVGTVNYVGGKNPKFVDQQGGEIDLNGKTIKNICEIHPNGVIIELNDNSYIFIPYDAGIQDIRQLVMGRVNGTFEVQ